MRGPAETFSRAALGWIIGVAAVSFVLAIVLAAFSDDLARPETVGSDTFSTSALGHAALAEVLEAGGVDVIRSRADATRVCGPDRPLLLLEPSGPPASELAQRIRAARRQRRAPVVLALTKWQGHGDPQNRRWLARVAPSPAAELSIFKAALKLPDLELQRAGGRKAVRLRCETAWGEPLEAELAGPQLIRPCDELEPIVSHPTGWLVARVRPRRGEHGLDLPPLLIVADPDLYNTHGLGRADNAVVVDRLLRSLKAGGVVFDETIHGHGRSDGVLYAMMQFPLVLIVLHALLVIGLALWSGMVRFGKPEPPAPGLGSGKQVLIDNTARLLTYGGHTADSLGRYFDSALTAVAQHYFLPRELPRKAKLAQLQALAEGRGVTVELRQLALSVAHPPSGQRDRIIRLADEIWRWRQEMIDGPWHS